MTYKKLQKEFEKKVANLQKECKHARLSPWMEKWWAIGHSTGNYVKVCKTCNLEILWKGTESYCPNCKETFNAHYIECTKCKVELERRFVEKNRVTGEKKIL